MNSKIIKQGLDQIASIDADVKKGKIWWVILSQESGLRG
jgi:hypothetical protein